MSSTATVFTHSIGRKVVMGLTGLFLVTFLFVHVGGNSLLFIPDDGRTFNAFVKFMTTNPVIKALELVLAAGFIFHIIYAFILTAKNNSARPVKYAFKGAKDKGSSWVSRNMFWTGGVVLIFLALHIPMFYGAYHFNKTGNGTITLQQAFEDNWKVKKDIDNSEGDGFVGFIHNCVIDNYLNHHEAPEDIELYFCGPPLMNKAVQKMGEDYGIPDEHIRFDDFGG